jgi:hypothetical protein
MIDFILENLDGFFKWLGVAVSVGTLIAGATPTTKDDSIVGKVKKVADYLSVVNTAENRAKLEKYSKKNK